MRREAALGQFGGDVVTLSHPPTRLGPDDKRRLLGNGQEMQIPAVRENSPCRLLARRLGWIIAELLPHVGLEQGQLPPRPHLALAQPPPTVTQASRERQHRQT